MDFLAGVGLGASLAAAILWLVRRRHGAAAAADHARDAQTPSNPSQQRRLLDSAHHLAAGVDAAITRHCHALTSINRRLGDEPASAARVHEAVSELIEANARLQADLMLALQAFREHQRQLERLIDQARTDPLTELANRRAFDLELARLFAQRQRQGVVFALLLIDLDRFKQVNDRFGHLVGDRVLQQAASVLRSHLREMDFVARYGGEEFAALLPGTDLREATRAAERVRSRIAQEAFTAEGRQLHLTTCVGVAAVRPGDIAESLVRRADVALYAAKAAGRNRTFVHDGERCLSADEFLAVRDGRSPSRLPANRNGPDLPPEAQSAD